MKNEKYENYVIKTLYNIVVMQYYIFFLLFAIYVSLLLLRSLCAARPAATNARCRGSATIARERASPRLVGLRLVGRGGRDRGAGATATRLTRAWPFRNQYRCRVGRGKVSVLGRRLRNFGISLGRIPRTSLQADVF